MAISLTRILRRGLAPALVVAMTPAVAFAEVMDKEPSTGAIWVWALVAGLVGALALWLLPRVAALIVSGVTLFIGGGFLLTIFLEIGDPFVGPAIMAEAGPAYVAGYWAAVVVFVALYACGLVIWMRRRRTSASSRRVHGCRILHGRRRAA